MKIGVFGVVTPTSVPVTDVARQVEAAGLDGLFLGEHYHLPVDSGAVYTDELPDLYKHVPDPLMLLSAAAVVTSRIRLGTTISITPIHDPLVLATRIGTLDMLSAGRTIYGMGVGWNRPELENHGVDFATRRARLAEQIEAMKALWANPTTGYHGDHVRFTESWQGPKPVQRPHPPLLFGAGPGRINFELLARHCDGWIPTSLKESDGLEANLGRLREATIAAGRDPDSLVNMMLLVEQGIFDTPPEAYAEAITEGLLRRYEDLGFAWVAVGVPFFGAEHCAAAIEHLGAVAGQWT